MRLLPGADGLQRDVRGALVRKVELTGRDAAERDAAQPVFGREIQAGAVAGGQQRVVLRRDRPAHNRPHRVQHIPAGQVKGRRDLGAAGRLLRSLGRHQPGAGRPQLHPGKGVDRIVNAPVAGRKAAEQGAVGGVDDRIALQCRDIALPEVKPCPGGGEGAVIGDALAAGFLLQKGVLQSEETRACRHRRADVHERAEQPPLFLRGIRPGQPGVGRALVPQDFKQLVQPGFLRVGVWVRHRQHLTIACTGQCSKQLPQCRQCCGWIA